MCVPKNSLNRCGFALVGVILAMAMIPAIILACLSIASHVRYGAAMDRSLRTRNAMIAVQNWVIGQAKDIDGDTYYEPLKEGAGNTLPDSPIPSFTVDGYGKPFRYCTWDLGSFNGNATYSQNNVAPPSAGLVATLISSGANGVFETSCTDTAAKGDDLAVLVSDTAIKYGGAGTASGWTTNGTDVSQSNPTGKAFIFGALSMVPRALPPAVPVAGDFYYDILENAPKYYNGTEWLKFSGVPFVVDSIPDAFSFIARTNVARSTVTTSNQVTITGINTAASISVTGTGTGQECSVNGGAWGACGGTISNNQSFSVRHTSSANYSTLTTSAVTIGGVSATWNVTTLGAPCSTGYAAKGFACPEVTGDAPVSCPVGFVGVPQMKIPVETNGATLTVPAFCVAQYVTGSGNALGTATTTPYVSVSWDTIQGGSCNSMSTGAMLIRESQWMALAHNILLVGSNWTGGAVDSGDVKDGLNNSECGIAAAASYNSCPDASAPGRERTLTNGNKVYDIGGNIYQWTYHDGVGGSAGKFGNITRDQTAAPYNSQTRGLGLIPDSVAGNASYTLPYTAWAGGAPLRGGYWVSGVNAGPFLLSSVAPSLASTYRGFRCTK